MKKLINDVSTVLTESLDGFAAAHADSSPSGRSTNSCSARC